MKTIVKYSVILAGCVLQILYFYYFFVYSLGETALEGKWISDICDDCEMKPNCYPSKKNEHLCGLCFACKPQRKLYPNNEDFVDREFVFGVSTTPRRRAKFLLLIGSIHKFFPTHKIIVYEYGERIKDEVSMSLLRNVEVRRWNDEEFFPYLHYKDRDAYYIHEILAHHKSVLWLNDDLELKDDQLFEVLGAKSLSTWGGEFLPSLGHTGIGGYFPGYIGSARNFSALYARKSDRKRIEWAIKCLDTLNCGECHSRSGTTLPCLPYILSRLSIDQDIPHFHLPQSIAKQVWEMPSCDFYCMLNFGILVVGIIVFLSVVLFYASNKFIVNKDE